jgi:hypothetical protein
VIVTEVEVCTHDDKGSNNPPTSTFEMGEINEPEIAYLLPPVVDPVATAQEDIEDVCDGAGAASAAVTVRVND